MLSKCDNLAYSCTACGCTLHLESRPYLLLDHPATRRIAILRWSETLAARNHSHAACSPEHALEMVAHWMLSGRLDLTFTQTITEPRLASTQPAAHVTATTELYRPIGELVINRESVRKLVASDPDALASVLDSLREVLLRDQRHSPTKKPARSVAGEQRVGAA